MRLPKHINVEEIPGKMAVRVSVKRWGIPILFFKAMRRFEGIKWYHWLIIYPRACVKAMIKGVD